MDERPPRGTDLRLLRERAGLTQAELAARLGIPASVLSAYERGRREPRVDVFFRAVEAAGFDVVYRPAPRFATWTVPDAQEKAEVLMRVTAMGMSLPRRDRGALTYPPFHLLLRGAHV